MNKTTTKRMFKAIEDRDAATLIAILDEHADAIETFGEHNRNVRDKTPLMFAMQCSDFVEARTDASPEKTTKTASYYRK